VAAAIIERDGKFLIARRRRGDTLGGLWEFPGGKIEPGETPEACLKRELKEELNIETEIGSLFASTVFIYYLVPVELLAYRVKYISGDFKMSEHDEMAWVTAKELDNYGLVSADRPIAKALLTSCGMSPTI
jgi:8-oxo-dGTP diphosphatase